MIVLQVVLKMFSIFIPCFIIAVISMLLVIKSVNSINKKLNEI